MTRSLKTLSICNAAKLTRILIMILLVGYDSIDRLFRIKRNLETIL